jgi:hypothetical protein
VRAQFGVGHVSPPGRPFTEAERARHGKVARSDSDDHSWLATAALYDTFEVSVSASRSSWGITGQNLYLLDVLRRRMEYPEMKRAVMDAQARLRLDVVPIAGRGSGTKLIQCPTGNVPLCFKTPRRPGGKLGPIPQTLRISQATMSIDRTRFRPPDAGRPLARRISGRVFAFPARRARRPGPRGHFVPGATAQFLELVQDVEP